MKIFFKQTLNGLDVDKYQVAKVLKISTNAALELIMYENAYHTLNVADIKAIKKAFHIDTDAFIEDERPEKMTWHEVRKLLDAKADRVRETVQSWNWDSLNIRNVNDCPLKLVEQLGSELNINTRALMFG